VTVLSQPAPAVRDGQARDRALDAWRSAAALVRASWDAYRTAAPSDREAAFAAYAQALDLEAGAADELAGLTYPPICEAA
jgi:hypothetical protein